MHAFQYGFKLLVKLDTEMKKEHFFVRVLIHSRENTVHIELEQLYEIGQNKLFKYKLLDE